MALNIRKRAAHATAQIKIIDPVTNKQMLDEEGNPITVTAYGPGSKVAAEVKAARTGRMLTRMKDAKGSNVVVSADQQIKDTAEDLTQLTVSLDNLDYDGDATPVGIKALYSDLTVGFVTEQVDQGVAAWANFMQGSTTA